MLLLRLHIHAADGAAKRDLRGLIVSGDNELVSRFYCGLQIQQHQFSEGLLHAAPRWAEPVLGFVARCIDAVEFESSLPPPLSTVQLRVIDARRGMREIAQVSARLIGGEGASNPWHLVRDQCLEEAFGQAVVPSLPPPLNPPVLVEAGRSYCRLADLPADARLAANWVFRREDRLALAGGVKDAVSPEQMNAFLSNNMEVPRPFGGWLWP